MYKFKPHEKGTVFGGALGGQRPGKKLAKKLEGGPKRKGGARVLATRGAERGWLGLGRKGEALKNSREENPGWERGCSREWMVLSNRRCDLSSFEKSRWAMKGRETKAPVRGRGRTPLSNVLEKS